MFIVDRSVFYLIHPWVIEMTVFFTYFICCVMLGVMKLVYTPTTNKITNLQYILCDLYIHIFLFGRGNDRNVVLPFSSVYIRNRTPFRLDYIFFSQSTEQVSLENKESKGYNSDLSDSQRMLPCGSFVSYSMASKYMMYQTNFHGKRA